MSLNRWAVGELLAAAKLNEPVDALNPGAWTNITAASGVTATTARVRLEGLDKVRLQGTLTKTSGTWSAGSTTIATIPSGFRPSRSWVFPGADQTSATMRIVIDSAGNLQITVVSGTPSVLFLDGPTWTTT